MTAGMSVVSRVIQYCTSEVLTDFSVPPLQWCQVRVTRVVPTISLLSKSIQEKLVELHAKRLTYAPILAVRASEGYKTFDDNQHASKTPSHITIRAHSCIDCLLIRYLDGTHSSHHGGSGGTGHQFMLANGTGLCFGYLWRLLTHPYHRRTYYRYNDLVQSRLGLRAAVFHKHGESLASLWWSWRNSCCRSLQRRGSGRVL